MSHYKYFIGVANPKPKYNKHSYKNSTDTTQSTVDLRFLRESQLRFL